MWKTNLKRTPRIKSFEFFHVVTGLLKYPVEINMEPPVKTGDEKYFELFCIFFQIVKKFPSI